MSWNATATGDDKCNVENSVFRTLHDRVISATYLVPSSMMFAYDIFHTSYGILVAQITNSLV